jgi:nucleoside-diphosphate-sugar epimerase
MTLLNHALRAGRSSPGATVAASTVLVAGGGGALGSAVLESLLAGRRFAHVKVLATRALTTAMHGLEPVLVDAFDDVPAAAGAPIADIAVIVFDRERHANGRELAFVRPQPQELAVLARWLHARGAKRLIVVLPHSPAALPDALKLGLANLDEQAAAALGFEHLVFVRSAQKPGGARAEQWLQRLADGVLAQMQMMVATSNQPVRAHKVAQFVGELAAQLGASDPGTRVVPPELVWQAAQMRDATGLVQAWLARRELPAITAPRRRM